MGHEAAVAEDGRPLEHVPKLADVSGPGVSEERLLRVAGDPGRGTAQLGADLLEECSREGQDVLRALAQRRDPDLEDGEPVVEIFAERAACHGRSQVAVGSGDDADVGLQGPRPAEPLELALLEDAKELGLDRRARLADLVEEENAPLCQIDPARLGRVGPGERPLLVTEKLGLEQRVGKGGAVQCDERAPGAARGRVEVAGEDLLAGPGLAPEQDGRLGGGDFRRLRQDLLPGRRNADDARRAPSCRELRGKPLDAALELSRALLRLGGIPGLFGETVVRQGKVDEVGDPPRDEDIALGVGARPEGDEVEPPDDDAVLLQGDPQDGAEAELGRAGGSGGAAPRSP